jgi:hypothetical protein
MAERHLGLNNRQAPVVSEGVQIAAARHDRRAEPCALEDLWDDRVVVQLIPGFLV